MPVLAAYLVLKTLERADKTETTCKTIELTANSLLTHIKTHSKLILRPLIANSQDKLNLGARCQPFMSLQLTP